MDIVLDQVIKRMGEEFTLEIKNLITPHGGITAVVGNNGAGKTTLLSILAGVRQLDYGTIALDSTSLTNKTRDWWKSKVGVYLDESFLFDYYTVMEHFQFIREGWKISQYDWEQRLHGFEPSFHLRSFYTHRISVLSSGNKKKTGLMGSLLIRPDVIIWDEPFNGLDTQTQELLKALIRRENERHETTFVLSSHNLLHIAELCDDIVILDNGRISSHIKSSITYEELKQRVTRSGNSEDVGNDIQDEAAGEEV